MEDQIKLIDHFSQLDEVQLKQLIEGSEIKTYQSGERILSADVSPDFYSFLITGKWWMQRQVVGIETPREWIDDRPGNWHGGIGLIDKIAPPTVKAETVCHVIHVPRDLLNALAGESPHLAISMLRGVSGGATMLYDHAIDNLCV
ncbi:MAG: hypothetical protein AAFN08_00630 [Cyanobacteria bacterium J06559_3]